MTAALRPAPQELVDLALPERVVALRTALRVFFADNPRLLDLLDRDPDALVVECKAMVAAARCAQAAGHDRLTRGQVAAVISAASRLLARLDD